MDWEIGCNLSFFNKYYSITLKRAKRNNNCLVPACSNSILALALSPSPSSFLTNPTPNRSCSTFCPTSKLLGLEFVLREGGRAPTLLRVR